MKKTDYRHENRKAKRDLATEMELYCSLIGKRLTIIGGCSGGVPIDGIVRDINYLPGGKINLCRGVLDNGAEFTLKINRGKIDEKLKKIIIANE